MLVEITPNISLDQAIKIMRRKVKKSGIMDDIEKHSYYVKPSIRKREKSKAARIRKKYDERKAQERKDNPYETFRRFQD